MILYIIRHGDPVYEPDGLTPLGKRQAEALSRRFCQKGLDAVYSSPQWRARETAMPTCECLHISPRIENFMAEERAFERFSVSTPNGPMWIFSCRRKEMYLQENCIQSRENWYEAPVYNDIPHIRENYEALVSESDDFMSRIGFQRQGGLYRLTGKDPGRVAVFCHQGFGTSWLSHLLYLPPQLAWRGIDIRPSTVTTVAFNPDGEGICAPLCLGTSDQSHLFGDGLPMYF